MRAGVIYLAPGKSVQYVFGIKHIIWPNVACPTSYDAMTPASLIKIQDDEDCSSRNVIKPAL